MIEKIAVVVGISAVAIIIIWGHQRLNLRVLEKSVVGKLLILAVALFFIWLLAGSPDMWEF